MVFIFWLSVVFVFYTYVGYPLLICIKAQKAQAKSAMHITGPNTLETRIEWPAISIIIPIHNEAHHIQAKIANLKALDYPKDKLTITFVSDGSEDGSNEQLEQIADVKLIAYHPRAGKPTALNTAIAQQTTDIIVLSDARQIIAADAVKKLVHRLQQPGIGAVSAELCFGEPSDTIAQSVGLYWKYEKAIRTWESQVHSVAGVTGALYAIYRQDYVPLSSDTLLDDFEVPMHILKYGLKVVLENGAFVYDTAQSDAAIEKTRKIRTLTGNFQSFRQNPWLFTTANPILWQFISHKVCRLLVPYFLLLALVTNISIQGQLFDFFLFIQIFFYGAGFLALQIPSLRTYTLPNFAALFMELNWAAVQGFVQYQKKSYSVRWEKTT